MLYFQTLEQSTLELLKYLQSLKGLENARLVGGTGLALQLGHRISVDLDLFANPLGDDFLSIITAIKKGGHNIEIRQQTSRILICLINDVKVDIENYPFPWIDDAEQHLLPIMMDKTLSWEQIKFRIKSETTQIL